MHLSFQNDGAEGMSENMTQLGGPAADEDEVWDD